MNDFESRISNVSLGQNPLTLVAEGATLCRTAPTLALPPDAVIHCPNTFSQVYANAYLH